MILLNWRLIFCETVLLLITLSIELLSQSKSPILREEKTVIVDSKIEHWRLEWRTEPQLACDPNDEDWYTCPCHGFAYGEKGELDLVRQIPGLPDERLSLTPFLKMQI